MDLAPDARKIHVDIDRSSINKTVAVDLPIIGDVGEVMRQMIARWKAAGHEANELTEWKARITGWKARQSLAYPKSEQEIMPQYAIERLFALTREHDPIISTEVGQHQMWAA